MVSHFWFGLLIAQWDVLKVAILHRLGTVAVGQASVAIYVSSAHRKEVSFMASFPSLLARLLCLFGFGFFLLHFDIFFLVDSSLGF